MVPADVVMMYSFVLLVLLLLTLYRMVLTERSHTFTKVSLSMFDLSVDTIG